jgi:hypothetical protein
MNTKPDSKIHFPTSQDKGAVPFPCSEEPTAEQQDADNGAPAEQQPAPDAQLADKAEPELSEEELRLMADTMPGDGPGD